MATANNLHVIKTKCFAKSAKCFAKSAKCFAKSRNQLATGREKTLSKHLGSTYNRCIQI